MGIMLAGLISALIMPIKEDGPEVLLENELWRVVYAFPILMLILVMLVIYFFFPNPSLLDELNHGKIEVADELIKKIYGVQDASSIRQDQMKHISNGVAESISLKVAFTDSKYRRAHWNSLIVCLF